MPIKAVSNGKTFTFPDGTSQEDAADAIDNYFAGSSAPKPAEIPTQEQPQSFASKVGGNLLSEAKGLGAGVVGTAGLPMDTLMNIADLAKAGVGYAQSKITGRAPSEIFDPIDRSKVPFTSEAMMPEALKMTERDNPYLYAGGAGVSGALLARKIPGNAMSLKDAAVYGQIGGMGSQAGRDIEQEVGGDAGGNVGAVLGGIAAPAIASTAAKSFRVSSKPQNEVLDQTIKESRDVGYKISPSQSNSGPIPRALEGALSGKVKTEQELVIKNQNVTNDLARKSIGLTKDDPLTGDSIKSVINKATAEGYEPVKNIGKIKAGPEFAQSLVDIDNKFQSFSKSFSGAEKDSIKAALKPYYAAADNGEFNSADAIGAIRSLRADAKAEFKNGDPSVGKVKIAISKAIEDAIERDLSSRGDTGPEILDNYRAARKLIAKADTVDRALVEGGGNVDASKIGAIYQKSPNLMDGDLAKIGKFANNFKQVSRLPKGGDSNPFSVWDAGMTTVGLGASAAGTGGASLALAGVPLARYGAKKLITSDAFQNAMNTESKAPIPLSDLATNQLINPSNQIQRQKKKGGKE